MPTRSRFPTPLLILLLIASLLRVAIVWRNADELQTDPDAYVAIATGIAESNTYASGSNGKPTAYRPPLYPVMLGLLLKTGARMLAVGVLQIGLGVATVWLTWIGCEFITGPKPLTKMVAGLMVACDPVLVMYTPRPMTEVLCTFLVTAWLVVLLHRANQQTPSQASSILCGVLFGLAALCRPTLWAAGAFVTLWWAIRNRGQYDIVFRVRSLGMLLLTIAVVVSPWVLRNTLVMGRPILTTTHGGYTLLLGNNPVFDQEVVAKPFGATWSGESLGRWQADLQSRHTEIWNDERKRDDALSAEAKQFILQNPSRFLAACWLRTRRFWNVTPTGPAASNLPVAALVGVGIFYGTQLLFALSAVISTLTNRTFRMLDLNAVMLLTAVILAFACVHMIYWSNLRMRAPVTPALAILVGVAIRQTQLSRA